MRNKSVPLSLLLALYCYDPLSRRTNLYLGAQGATCSAGGGTNSIGYGYDANSNLNQLTNVLAGATVGLTYGRNNSGQITRVDAGDNTYLPTPASSNVAYVPNTLNQYTAVGGQSATYDVNGNLKSWYQNGALQSYTYDSENKLVAALDAGTGVTTTYDYDGLGRRVTKTSGATVTQYLLDGDEEIAEYSGASLLRRYITGPAIDDRIARAEGSGTSNPTKYYYHVNHQGTVIASTDGVGNLQQKLTYDEYGLSTSSVPTSGEAFRYTGRRYDAESGLYYYRARYYSPTLGRFLQSDPVGYRDDLNLYAYVGNDPANKVDPTGTIADTLLDIGFIGYDIYELATNPSWTNAGALGADIVGAAVPFATGLGAAVRGVEKGAEIARGADKATEAAKTVHGNSVASTKAQHRYEIKDTKTGDVKKTGISGQKVNNDGSSPRANRQVNQLNRQAGEQGRYAADVKETNIPGREAALNSERSATAELKQQGNSLELQCRPDPNKLGGC